MANIYFKHFTTNHNNRSIVRLLTIKFPFAGKLKASILSPVPASTKRTSAFYLSKCFIVALLLLVVGVASMRGATKTWTGVTNTSWTTATNWSGGVPGSSDDVIIGDFSPGSQPTLSTSVTINSLTLNGRSSTSGHRGGMLTIAAGITLTISGNLTINGASGGGTGSGVGIIAQTTASVSVGGVFLTVNNTGGPEDAAITMGSGSFTVTGNLTFGSNTTLTANTSTFIFNKASGTQTVNNAAANDFYNITHSGAGTLQISTNQLVATNSFNNSNGGTVDLNKVALTVGDLQGNGIITSRVAGAVTLTAGSDNGSTSFSGIIQDGTGTVALTKTGTGTLNLSGLNTFTGAVTINNGTLQSGITNALGTNAVIVNDGGTYDLNGYSDAISTLAVNSGTTGGTVTTGAGTLTLGGNVTSTGGAGNATISGNLALGATRMFTLTNAADGLIVSAIVSGSYGITKAGAGTLTLSGNNTYTGTTTISVGTLLIGNASALGTGAASITSGAVLDLNGTTYTNTNALTLNGTGISTGGSLINSSSTAATYNGAITLGSNSSIGGTGNITLGNGITGGFTLTKVGSAILNLGSSAATLAGLTISAGTLNSTSGNLSLTGNFANSSNFTHNNGTVTMNGAAQTINGTSSTTFNNLTLATSGGSVTKTFSIATVFSSNLTINASVVANLGTFNHSAGSLTLVGLGSYTTGTWGNNGSVTNKNTTFFAATTGMVTVSTPPTITCPSTIPVFVNPLTGLMAAYPFNETSGTVAHDVIGNRNASFVNSPSWDATGESGGDVLLHPASSDYVQLPAGIVSSLTGNFSISTWFYWSGVSAWQRIFDFGKSSTTGYMYLTAYNSGSNPRFAITTSTNGNEQGVNGTNVLTTNAWHHAVVTLSENTCTLYIDGVSVGTNTSMTIHPSDLGNTANNFIGKSQFANPYFNGKIDEFRIYNIALTADQVTTLYGATGCAASVDYGTGLGVPTTSGTAPLTATNNAVYPLPSGSNTITWTAKDANNLTSTCTQSVTVAPISFGGTLADQLSTNTTYTLTGGLPVGGTYSGTGVTGTNFNASAAGGGTFTITYTYPYTYADGTSCTQSATNTINVIAPTILVSSSMTGFSYTGGAGPSAQQSFTVSGIYLTNNIILSPPDDYEISTTSGSGFQSTPVTLLQTGGNVSSTTIYVRMKAGLTGTSFPENIILTSIGANAQNVALNGTVSYCIPSSLVPWGSAINSVQFTSYMTNSIPSVAGYTDLTASYAANVSIGSTYPLNVKINTNGNNTFDVYAWIDWNQNGVFDSNEIYNLGSLTNASNNAPSSSPYSISVPGIAFIGTTRMRIMSVISWDTNGPCDTSNDMGEAEDYTINVLPSITQGTITGSPFNAGDAISVPFTTNGNFSAGNVFTAQLSDASGSFSAPVTLGILTATSSGIINGIIPGGTATGTSYRIRVVGSSPAVTGPDNGVNITINAGAAITRSVTTLSGFSYAVLNGPSPEQSFTVAGTSLTAPIVITPPADFEVSVLSGGIFYSSSSLPTNTISLSPSAGAVNATIYVRLKAGLSVAGYGPESITLSSTGFTSKTVTCSGYVNPGITAGGGGSYCAGNSISLTSSPIPGTLTLTNVYWTGPNSYYSLLANPTIPSATTAMTGTYSVNGSLTNGSNLVTNGSFELGNTGFSSSYLYVDSTSTAHGSGAGNALWDEATYSVCTNPHSVHSLLINSTTVPSAGPISGKKQMVINGAATPGVSIWNQTVTVNTNTNYQFTYWLQSINNPTDPAPSQLQLLVNGTPIQPIFTANPTGGVWKQYLYNWSSETSTTAFLSLINQQTAGGGNDFALDSIVFNAVYPVSASVDVSILSGSQPPTVTIAASPSNVVNSGTSVTFTAVPYNGGIAPPYQWKLNGTNVGTNSPNYTYIPTTSGDVITCVLTSNSSCLPSGNQQATSNAITMTVNTTVNYWKGTNGTDWGTPSNWTAGYVPATGDNVVFSTSILPYGDASSNLVLDVDRTIGNLTNQSTKALIIPPARSLNVNGTITTNGSTSPGSIYIQASQDGSEQNGSLIFPNASNVYATVEMYSKGHSIPAPGIQYPPVTGRYYRYSWQYFGIPVNTIYADPTFYGSYVRSWYEPGTTIDTHWVQLSNSSQLNPFIGYELTQDVPIGKVIVFQGQLINPSPSWTSPIQGRTATGALFPGQFVFANPYTAAIDIQLFRSRLGSDTDGNVYLYSTGSYNDWGVTGGQGANTGISAGQYQVVTSTTGTGIPTQIPSMQAVLVQMKTGNQAGSTVTFNYSDIVKNNDLQRVKSNAGVSATMMPYTMIDITGSSYSDRMWIFSDSTFTHRYDRGWDGKKMLGIALAPQLYAVEQDGNFQIDCVDDMNNTLLGFQHGIDTEYKLTFTHQNIVNKYSGIYLLDLVENKTVDITESGSTYSFLADSTKQTVNRFEIATIPFEKNAVDTNKQLKVFTAGSTVFIQNLSNLNGNMVIYDLLGHAIKQATFGPYGITTVQTSTVPGAYLLNAATRNDKVNKKFIIGN